MFNSARYCVKCGRGLRFKMRECPWCGTKVKNPDKSSKKYFWWAQLPFFGWIIGLILFFTLQNEYPRKAESAAVGVAVGIAWFLPLAAVLVPMFMK